VIALVGPGDERYQFVNVALFYPEQGMIAFAVKRDTKRIERVTPDYLVTEADYWRATDFPTLQTELQARDAPRAKWLPLAEDWSGYDAIKIVNLFER
jgi:hypothetical protein